MRKLLLYCISFCVPIVAYAGEGGIEPNNHPYANVRIAYPSDECSFQFSSVDFCDEKHLTEIKRAIAERRPDFGGKYILLSIPEGSPSFFQRSLVAIDTTTGIVYPVPIDAYSGATDGNGYAKSVGKLKYNIHSNQVCITGAIFMHRMVEDGNFCFALKEDRFVGHHTPYMDP
ncbi:hypothetical protein [Trinickia diaoshuihuensis]|jgi:hypothetical protein|uniref:hypothetical protein n=1 Tax=Trinickia diaoshuihuensis TaxID=2292265 RepID=UPI001F0799B5|nr:hypothetical protein [Trinickia diaoshuihuensis]